MATAHWLRALGAPAMVSWLMLAAPAAAQAPDADYETVEAREQFNLGVKAMEAGDCEAAIPHFKQALAFHVHHQIAGNLGACELELGRYPDAAEHLQRALEQVPHHDASRAALQRMHEQAMQKVGVLRVSVSGPSAASATLTLDGAPVSANEPVYVTAGEHVIEARAADAGAAPVTASVSAGDRLTVAIALLPKKHAVTSVPSDVDAEDDDDVDAVRVAMWSSYGVALAASAVGVGFLAVGISEQDEADARRDVLRSEGSCSGDCPELLRRYATVDTNYNTAGVLFGVGAAAAVAGTVLLLIDVLDDDAEVAVIPVWSNTEAGIGVKGTF